MPRMHFDTCPPTTSRYSFNTLLHISHTFISPHLAFSFMTQSGFQITAMVLVSGLALCWPLSLPYAAPLPLLTSLSSIEMQLSLHTVLLLPLPLFYPLPLPYNMQLRITSPTTPSQRSQGTGTLGPGPGLVNLTGQPHSALPSRCASWTHPRPLPSHPKILSTWSGK
jgi:hypothetical protein